LNFQIQNDEYGGKITAGKIVELILSLNNFHELKCVKEQDLAFNIKDQSTNK